MMQGQGIKKWDFQTKPLPPNHYLLTKPYPPFPSGIEFDILLSQNRFGNLQQFLELGDRLKLPVINIDHCLPPKEWSKAMVKQVGALKANKNIFITEFNKNVWGDNGNSQIIYHGIDTNVFKGWSCPESNKYGISVVNQFATRDVWCGWTLWNKVKEKFDIRLVGDNPGISESAKSVEDLVSQLSESAFFLNTSQWSPVPLSLLEAMSMGMPVISTAKQEIPNIIKHGENGFLAETPEEMLEFANKLIDDRGWAQQLGKRARETIVERFSIERFLSEWKNVFQEVYESNR